MSAKKIVVISGPSGSGESTVTEELLKRHPEFTHLTAATSRPPRSNEKEGEEYYFFSKEQFLEQIQKGNILEYTYIANRDTYYGTYKPELEKKLTEDKKILITCDIVGVQYYKKNHGALVLIIEAGAPHVLLERIQKRTPNISSQELESRRKNIIEEQKLLKPTADYVILNENGKLEQTLNQIEDILRKEGYLPS